MHGDVDTCSRPRHTGTQRHKDCRHFLGSLALSVILSVLPISDRLIGSFQYCSEIFGNSDGTYEEMAALLVQQISSYRNLRSSCSLAKYLSSIRNQFASEYLMGLTEPEVQKNKRDQT
jgi:hypothetical protein